METDKPLISILMAVYEPRIDWLKEQLDSLNAQTYPNLRLYVRDDCSPTVSFEEILRLVRECITAFPYSIERNEKNLGSNGTFERLTREAEGEYFAYCDQDDVWLPEKLSILCEKMKQSGAMLVCSDAFIIDESGNITADSIKDIRRRHVFLTGAHLAPYLMVRNFIVGCTMLVRSSIAQQAIPFEPEYVHDQWIGIVAAAQGVIEKTDCPLIGYRQHGGNQTGILRGVYSRATYLEDRIDQPLRRFQTAASRIILCGDDRNSVDLIGRALEARKAYVQAASLKTWLGFIRCGVFSRASRLFDTALPFLHDAVILRMIHIAQNGKI